MTSLKCVIVVGRYSQNLQLLLNLYNFYFIPFILQTTNQAYGTHPQSPPKRSHSPNPTGWRTPPLLSLCEFPYIHSGKQNRLCTCPSGFYDTKCSVGAAPNNTKFSIYKTVLSSKAGFSGEEQLVKGVYFSRSWRYLFYLYPLSKQISIQYYFHLYSHIILRQLY